MWRKLWEKLKKTVKEHVRFGEQIDFPSEKKCDPNEPCRHLEPQRFKGFKAFWKW